MTRRTKASRRAAFLRHVSLPVRYTCRSTREAERFMEAMRPRVLSVSEAPDGCIRVVPFAHLDTVTVTFGWSP